MSYDLRREFYRRNPLPPQIHQIHPQVPRELSRPHKIHPNLNPFLSTSFKLIQNKRLYPPAISITFKKQGEGGVTPLQSF